jgi:hypothetical protein
MVRHLHKNGVNIRTAIDGRMIKKGSFLDHFRKAVVCYAIGDPCYS